MAALCLRKAGAGCSFSCDFNYAVTNSIKGTILSLPRLWLALWVALQHLFA